MDNNICRYTFLVVTAIIIGIIFLRKVLVAKGCRSPQFGTYAVDVRRSIANDSPSFSSQLQAACYQVRAILRCFLATFTLWTHSEKSHAYSSECSRSTSSALVIAPKEFS